MGAAIERLTGIPLRDQWPAWMVGLGHGGTHWVLATYLIMAPYFTKELGISYAEAGLLFACFHVASFVANFGSGAAVDIVGRRVFLQVIALIFGALALALIKWADGFWYVVPAVGLIGATNNLWHPPAISYLSSTFPEKRGYALSLHALGASVGDAIAPFAAGFLIAHYGWRDTAPAASAPVIVIAILLLMALGPKEKADNGDAKGKKMSGRDYFDGLKVMMSNRLIAALCITAGFRTMTMMGLLMFLPFYLADEMGMGATVVGATLMVMQLGGLVVTPIAGIWSDRSGRRRVVLAGFTGTTVILAALTFIDNDWALVGSVAFLGFSLYAARPVMHSWMMDVTPPELSGSAMSLMFGTQALFNITVPPMGGWIADHWGLGAVFYMLAGTILVANLLVVFIPDSNPGQDKSAG
ncbi:MAG: MFS transporter [Rhodospirillaceae bacterium]